jgi:RimJ/RimL family protein N-acetyltransferase
MEIKTSEWEKETFARLKAFKDSPFGEVRVKDAFNGVEYELLLLTGDRASDDEIINLLGRWRKENEDYFLGKFQVTMERTRAWFKNHLMEKPDRALFIVRAPDGYIGHVGLFRFESEIKSCEIDNIVRGEKKYPGIMGAAIISMMRWGKSALGIEGYTLKVLADNERAIRLYVKLGFVETGRIPLMLITGKDGPEWTEAPADWTGKPGRFYSVMTFRGSA